MDSNQFLSTIKSYSERHGQDALLRVMEVHHPTSVSVFLARLYCELNSIVREMEQSANMHQGDGEDKLTVDIVRQLRRVGYEATHDAYSKGHPDIKVTQDAYAWLGECKVHGEYDWLIKGMKQLYDKYSTGNEDGLGLLIYIPGKNAKAVLTEWRSRLTADGTCGLKGTRDGGADDKLCFWSTHQHIAAGGDVETKHIGVALYVQPNH